jgi:uncharacterized Zn finger protein
MSPARYPWPEPSRPIPADGGIKAKSKRGAIGAQWWSRRFISVLESYGMSGRLQRGRSYARKGQVLEFELTQGRVIARVQGSRPQPYKVSIGVLPLTTSQWRAVEEQLASQALFRAKLLAGEMPAEIEAVFAECGTPLFPRSASDLDMRCSCPDWEVPCKHLAAVCYVLAEAFDNDPFGMLAWRGRTRQDLLAALRRGGPQGSAAPAGVPEDPLEGRLADFWSPGLSLARLRALAAPAVTTGSPDLLLRMFEPPPLTVRGKSLRDVLAPAYDRLAAEELRCPGALHRLGQSPPAKRREPVVVVDRAEHAPHRGNVQEQPLDAEFVEIVGVTEPVGFEVLVAVPVFAIEGRHLARVEVAYVPGEVGRGSRGPRAARGQRRHDRQPVVVVKRAHGGHRGGHLVRLALVLLVAGAGIAEGEVVVFCPLHGAGEFLVLL